MSPPAQLRSDTTFSRICNLGKFGNASALNLFCMIFMEIREQEGRGSVPGDGRTGGAGDQCGFIPGNRCLLESLTRGITILHLSVEQCDFTHSMSISLPGSHRNGSGAASDLRRPGRKFGAFFTGTPVWCRSVTGRLPRTGVSCCVPLLASLNLRVIHSVSLPRLPRLSSCRGFFWRRPSCYGERQPPMPLTQIRATHALPRMTKLGSGRGKLQGRRP